MSLAAATVGDAVGPRAMPSHPDEQAAVMAEIGRPPILRIRHQGMQILDHGIEVEALEFLGIVERLAQRVGLGGMLIENLKAQLIRPPVTISATTRATRKRAFAFIRHIPSDLGSVSSV